MKGKITIEYEWNDVPEDCGQQLRDDLEHEALNRAYKLMTEGYVCGELVYSDHYSPPGPGNKEYHGWWDSYSIK